MNTRKPKVVVRTTVERFPHWIAMRVQLQRRRRKETSFTNQWVYVYGNSAEQNSK